MGQKTHPYGFRLGVVKTWTSKWYEDKQYAKWLHEDLEIRRLVRKKHSHAGIAGIEIERAANKLKVNILTSRPGIIIGRKGVEVDRLKDQIRKRTQRGSRRRSSTNASAGPTAGARSSSATVARMRSGPALSPATTPTPCFANSATTMPKSLHYASSVSPALRWCSCAVGVSAASLRRPALERVSR